MKTNLYSVRDLLNGFSAPMSDINDDTAQRSFAFAIQSQPIMQANCTDYDLFRVGSFDSEDCKFVLEDMPVLICRGFDVGKV